MRKKRSTASRHSLPRLHLGEPQAPFGARGAASAQGALGSAASRGRDLRPGRSLLHGPDLPPPRRYEPEPPNEGHLTHRCRASPPTGVSAPGMQRATHRPGREGSPRTAPPALTSALTCRASPHSAPARRSLCSGCGGRGQSQVFPGSRPSLPPPRPTNSARQPRTSPAVGEGGSLAPEPAPRAVRPAGPPESGERSRPATPTAHRGRRASAGPGRRRGRRAAGGRWAGAGPALKV